MDLASLIGEFYEQPEQLGAFVAVDQLAQPYASLLDHEAHMTVTVEQFHGRSVDVQVHRSLSRLRDGRMLEFVDPRGAFAGQAEEVVRPHLGHESVSQNQLADLAPQTSYYTREITLVTQPGPSTRHDRGSGGSGRIVQYGIVRLNTAAFRQQVWLEIASGQTPLGRVLIRHEVLREVQLCRLWAVSAGPSLARILEIAPGRRLFGRTALIRCDSQPAIELLEIVRVDEGWGAAASSSPVSV